MDQRYEELEARVRALEVSLGVFERMLGASLAVSHRGGLDAPLVDYQPRLLAMLTTKQHVALQMLMAGKSNAEIAERFGVTENGAKVYLRAIYKKFGINTRSQAVMAVYDEWERVSEERYVALSKGVPKAWAKDWLGKPVSDDPYWPIYSMSKDD
jgi:DNA-binding CsgD family transcriptional regulator